jgi:hypothetical protein
VFAPQASIFSFSIDFPLHTLFVLHQVRNSWTYLTSRFGDSCYSSTFVNVDWFHPAVLITMAIGLFFAWKPYLNETERANRFASSLSSSSGSANAHDLVQQRRGKASDVSKLAAQINASVGARAINEAEVPSIVADAAAVATTA